MTTGPVATTPGLHVGVDIGGTKVLAVALDDEGRVVAERLERTPGRTVAVDAVEATIVRAVRAVCPEPVAVGLAAAGFVDAARTRVMFAPHLPWRGEPVRDRLSAALGCPVVLDNDANCTALAELAYGAARGHSEALVITLGTGIGGALVAGGTVLRGANGMAGEFGHMQVVPGGAPCECGRTGCWEQYCSGNALVRYARARWGLEPTVMWDLCDGDAHVLTGPMVTEAAAAGDLVARSAFGTIGDWLGVGVANLVAAFDPSIVVIGGGVSAAGDMLLETARVSLARSLVGGGHRPVPTIVPSALGPRAGAIGGGVLAGSA